MIVNLHRRHCLLFSAMRQDEQKRSGSMFGHITSRFKSVLGFNKRTGLLVVGMLLVTLAVLATNFNIALADPEALLCELEFTQKYFDGIGDASSNVIAVSANINSREPRLCTLRQGVEEHSASSIWVLLGGGVNSDECAFAQAGYVKRRNTTVKLFTQWGANCGHLSPIEIWGVATEGNHLYQVRYNENRRKVNMWIDDIRRAYTDFDPGQPIPNGWGPQPWFRQWKAETHDRGDDTPGTSTNRVIFSYMLYQSCFVDCGWIPPAGLTAASSDPRYRFSHPDDSTLQIWTR